MRIATASSSGSGTTATPSLSTLCPAALEDRFVVVMGIKTRGTVSLTSGTGWTTTDSFEWDTGAPSEVGMVLRGVYGTARTQPTWTFDTTRSWTWAVAVYAAHDYQTTSTGSGFDQYTLGAISGLVGATTLVHIKLGDEDRNPGGAAAPSGFSLAVDAPSSGGNVTIYDYQSFTATSRGSEVFASNDKGQGRLFAFGKPQYGVGGGVSY